jgi:hypothetical protein
VRRPVPAGREARAPDPDLRIWGGDMNSITGTSLDLAPLKPAPFSLDTLRLANAEQSPDCKMRLTFAKFCSDT